MGEADYAQIAKSFLRDFRDLEAYLGKVSGIKDDFVSYSRALSALADGQSLPLVGEGDNLAFLRAAGDIRNIMVHNNDAAYPTPAFAQRFHNLALGLEHPVKVLDIATPAKDLVTAYYDTGLKDLTRRMDSLGLSHVPVLKKDLIVGVFSSATFFDLYLETGKATVSANAKLGDIKDVLGIDKHQGEAYLFCGPKAYAYEYQEKMTKKALAHQKRIAALFVTSTGRTDGRLLGMVTPTDFMKVVLDGK